MVQQWYNISFSQFFIDNIVLATDTALIKVDGNMKFTETVPYAFTNPYLNNARRRWVDAHYIVNSHKILIHDEKRLIIYNDDTRSFTGIPLPPEKSKSYFHITQDSKAQFYFCYDSTIYKLSPDNEITVYRTKEQSPPFGFTSLLMDRSGVFWAGGNGSGLYLFDTRLSHMTGMTYVKKFHEDLPGALPVNQLMNLVKDPSDNNILWISSLGGGLIRFNKTTGKCTTFTTQEGLPNNTVYAVVQDAKGMLWCSSNKGIFLFNPKEGMIVSNFTSEDGLMGDEFNRYHFLKMPDGRIAFGGVDGYTVFNPLYIQEDNFDPKNALTGISINNSPADYGLPGSPFKSRLLQILIQDKCNIAKLVVDDKALSDCLCRHL